MKLSRSGRFWVAAILWCAVAVMLIVRGVLFAWSSVESTTVWVIALGIALVVGVAKGIFVISKSADRNAGYIARRPEQDWFFLCFHPIMYALIPLMILMGWSLKKYVGGSYPSVVLAVYVGIGVALLVAIRGLWGHKAELGA